jgi:hypothetical protein
MIEQQHLPMRLLLLQYVEIYHGLGIQVMLQHVVCDVLYHSWVHARTRFQLFPLFQANILRDKINLET